MSAKKPLNHKIWQLAWPMMIANLSVPLLGIVDTAILGHLEDARYLGAVAVGSSLLAFVYWGFGFLRMGTTGLAAQAHGAAQIVALKRLLTQALLLGALIGLCLVILSPWLLKIGLALLAPPENSASLAESYCQIRLLSAPAVMVNYAITGWLIGRQNTRWPLLITLFTNGLNIGLDWLFIIKLGLNSDGAAWATLIAEYAGGTLALFIALGMLRQVKQPDSEHSHTSWSSIFNAPEFLRLLKVNRHLFLRTIALLASFAFFTAQGAGQGDIILAANAILLQLLMTVAFGLDGFAHAAEALSGDAIGRRNLEDFYAVSRQCGLWSLLTGLVFCLCYGLLGPYILSWMTSIEAVYQSSLQYLPWLVLLPLLAMPSYLFDGIFVGATRSAAMQNTMLLAVGLVYLPTWYVTQNWGNHGLWLAFILFNTSRGLFLGIAFWRLSRRRLWLENHA